MQPNGYYACGVIVWDDIVVPEAGWRVFQASLTHDDTKPFVD